jgi:hypothetical protein
LAGLLGFLFQERDFGQAGFFGFLGFPLLPFDLGQKRLVGLAPGFGSLQDMGGGAFGVGDFFQGIVILFTLQKTGSL